MSLNFPSFLDSPRDSDPAVRPAAAAPASTQNHPPQNLHPPQNQAPGPQANPGAGAGAGTGPAADTAQFDALLRSKLAMLDAPLDQLSPTFNANVFASQQQYPQLGHYDSYAPHFGHQPPADSFHLPRELQGGIGTISSRRPSYAAESFTRSAGAYVPPGGSGGGAAPPPANRVSLASLAAANNFSINSNRYGLDSLADSLDSFSLHSNFSDFQARRPSQLADFPPVPQSYAGFGLAQYNQNFLGSYGAHQQPFAQMSAFSPSFQPCPENEQKQFADFSHNGHNGQTHGMSQASHGAQNQGQGQNQNYRNQNHQNQSHQNQSHQNQSHQNQNHQNQNHQSQNHQNQNQHYQKQNFQNQNHQTQSIETQMKLENGLIVKDQYIVASPELKALFSSVSRYFQDTELSNSVLAKLKKLLTDEVVLKLINFIKNLNNLNFHHKMLCLVLNKNGRLDLLSYPNNSNVYLQRNDLVIVDGDRGKDLVMILEPHVTLDMAILFNFLKKIEHLRSLTINHSHGGASVKNNHCGGTHSTSLNASAIIDTQSNDDNEFIVTLPTKQVLRFATPKEIHKLSGKFLEEKKAFITCYNKIKELGLNHDLTLINVEYQCDFKKLIFYYFANFKRIDFRGLIKELFKIYKTRIWLCAVLPYDRPDLVVSGHAGGHHGKHAKAKESIPEEYNLSNEQIMNFSIKEFQNMTTLSYFHSRNMSILIDKLIDDTKGNFYGFHQGSRGAGSHTRTH